LFSCRVLCFLCCCGCTVLGCVRFLCVLSVLCCVVLYIYIMHIMLASVCCVVAFRRRFTLCVFVAALVLSCEIKYSSCSHTTSTNCYILYSGITVSLVSFLITCENRAVGIMSIYFIFYFLKQKENINNLF
jgi:hypothetical protein